MSWDRTCFRHPNAAQVITSRSYDDRLDTITAVRDAGISVCSGGILGLGETDADRIGLIWEMSKYAVFLGGAYEHANSCLGCQNTRSRSPSTHLCRSPERPWRTTR